MRAFIISISALFCILFASFSLGHADVDITILGAEPGPNQTGEIPAYTGSDGLSCPAGFQKGQYLPNPYPDEKPLFRIDHTNMQQYKHRLSPGQMERLKRHPKFYMNVYPTHRNVEFCPEFYAATEKNTELAYLDDKGALKEFCGGVAFPSPKNGLEAIWNIRRMYVGDDAINNTCNRVVSPSGRIVKGNWVVKVRNYGVTRLKSDNAPDPDGIAQKIRNLVTSPADVAGTAFLSIAYLDDNRLEDTWLYLPTLRRVRRAPSLSGGGQLQGELTMDENGLEFRGKIADWSWKLIGKKEMYVPYNCYDIWAVGASDSDECWAQDINPERIRYELHRVWVVEGTAREGLNHPYSKRVGYYDEDSWQALLADRYDRRGNLWRMYENYGYSDFCIKFRMTIGMIHMNLETGRYELFGGCREEDTLNVIYDTGIEDSAFTVQGLRKSGR